VCGCDDPGVKKQGIEQEEEEEEEEGKKKEMKKRQKKRKKKEISPWNAGIMCIKTRMLARKMAHLGPGNPVRMSSGMRMPSGFFAVSPKAA